MTAISNRKLQLRILLKETVFMFLPIKLDRVECFSHKFCKIIKGKQFMHREE